MDQDQVNIKLIGAVALGAIGGILLGRYIWGTETPKVALSDHLSTLSDILQQIEGIKTVEAEDLKERIHNILNTIESSYVSPKK